MQKFKYDYVSAFSVFPLYKREYGKRLCKRLNLTTDCQTFSHWELQNYGERVAQKSNEPKCDNKALHVAQMRLQNARRKLASVCINHCVIIYFYIIPSVFPLLPSRGIKIGERSKIIIISGTWIAKFLVADR